MFAVDLLMNGKSYRRLGTLTYFCGHQINCRLTITELSYTFLFGPQDRSDKTNASVASGYIGLQRQIAFKRA